MKASTSELPAIEAVEAGPRSVELPTAAEAVPQTPKTEIAAEPKAARAPSCIPAERLEPLSAILQKIQVARRRKLFVLIQDGVDAETYEEVYSWRAELKAAGAGAGLDVLIHSPGGELSACYQVARLLSGRASAWEALVPCEATSGATLICLGSANIVMSEVAQLGPIDPQVISKRHEKLFATERQSPLEAFQAVRYLRELALASLDSNMTFLLERGVAAKPALETACNLAVHVVQPILAKIEPYDLGAFALDSNLAVDYCKRVCSPADARTTQRKVNPRVLVERYPAHEFVIDIEEARVLGFNVSQPTPELDSLFDELRPLLNEVQQFVGCLPGSEV